MSDGPIMILDKCPHCATAKVQTEWVMDAQLFQYPKGAFAPMEAALLTSRRKTVPKPVDDTEVVLWQVVRCQNCLRLSLVQTRRYSRD